MTDLFHSLSAQVLNIATVVQPLHSLRFASLPEMNLPSPVELRQRPLVAGPGTENPDPLDFRASRLPAPLVSLAEPIADVPLPSFRQMGQAGTTNRIHARQSSLPFQVDDELDRDQVEEAAPPAGLLGHASVLDRAEHAFAAPVIDTVAASIPNNLATAEPRVHVAPAITAVEASSALAPTSLPTVAPAVDATTGLVDHQPGVHGVPDQAPEPLTKLDTEFHATPSLNSPQAVALTAAGHAAERQATPVVDKTAVSPTRPVALEPEAAAFAEPSTPSPPVERQSERAVRTLLVDQTAVDDTSTIRQTSLAATAARSVDALPGNRPGQAPVVRTPQPLETTVAPMLVEAPNRLPASAARRADEPVADELFAARPADEQPLDSKPMPQTATRFTQADQQPLIAPVTVTMADPIAPSQVMPVIGETSAATWSMASGVPADSSERVATPAMLGDAASLPTRIDRQSETNMHAAHAGNFAPATQALPSLLTQPALSASLTPSNRAEQPQVMPVLRDVAPTFAPSSESEVAPESFVEPATTVLPAGRQSDQSVLKQASIEPAPIEPASIEPAAASELALLSTVDRQAVVVPSQLNRAGPDGYPVDESPVKPVMHHTNPVTVRSTDPAPAQAFLAEPANMTARAGRPVTAVAPGSPLDEEVTDKVATGASATQPSVTPAAFVPAAPAVPSVADPKVLPVMRDLGAVVTQSADLGFTGAPTAEPASGLTTSSRPFAVTLPSIAVDEQSLDKAAPVSAEATARIANASSRAEPSVLPVVHDARGVATGAVDPESTQASFAEPPLKSVMSPALPAIDPSRPIMPAPGTANLSPAIQPLPVEATATATIQRKASADAGVRPLRMDIPQAPPVVLPSPTFVGQVERAAGGASRVDLPADVLPSPQVHQSTPPIGAEREGIEVGNMIAEGMVRPVVAPTVVQAPTNVIAFKSADNVATQAPIATGARALPGAPFFPVPADQGRHEEAGERKLAPIIAQALADSRQGFLATPAPDVRESSVYSALKADVGSAFSHADRVTLEQADSTSTTFLGTRYGEFTPATRVSEQLGGASRTPEATPALMTMIRPRSEPFAPAQPPKAPAIPPPLPTIRVTIGRVEVRTTPEAPKPAAQRRQPAPAPLSLDAYLKRGQREAR